MLDFSQFIFLSLIGSRKGRTRKEKEEVITLLFSCDPKIVLTPSKSPSPTFS
jgi:hypothetical protein